MAEESRALAPFTALKTQLEERADQYAAALPSTIKPERFTRTVLTAVTQNPQLLECHRGSLLLACMKCAQDGLVPDGREAALVIFRDKTKGKVAQYLAMVGGVRKMVLQSGEVSVFEQHVVYDNDIFDVRFGSDAMIDHRPYLKGERGAPVAVYSVAIMRDGYKSFEVMTVEDVDKVRDVSRTRDTGPWKQWYEEMAKKTVAKRHAKMLPLSSERAIPRDDDEPGKLDVLEPRERMAMTAQLHRLANGPTEEEFGDFSEHDEEVGNGEEKDFPPTFDVDAERAKGIKDWPAEGDNPRGRKPRMDEPGWSTATDAPPGAEG
jgi:recombination protein RecT